MQEAASSPSPVHQLSCLNTFFHPVVKSQIGTVCPNALLIDTEPKVIDSLLAPDPKYPQYSDFTYDPQKAVFMQQGSGNNWAYGYSTNGVKLHNTIFDKLRKLMERLDRVEGVLVL